MSRTYRSQPRRDADETNAGDRRRTVDGVDGHERTALRARRSPALRDMDSHQPPTEREQA